MSKTKGPGTVYLLCFDAPFHHAHHYIGWTSSLKRRLNHHRNGSGARLMRAVAEAGIEWSCVRTWEGDRTFERKLHNQHGGARFCPRCNPRLQREDACTN